MAQKARDDQGNETLSPLDKLYVVHVRMGKAKSQERWDAGGPLLPSLQVALASYPYTMIELEVSITVPMLNKPCLPSPWTAQCSQRSPLFVVPVKTPDIQHEGLPGVRCSVQQTLNVPA